LAQNLAETDPGPISLCCLSRPAWPGLIYSGLRGHQQESPSKACSMLRRRYYSPRTTQRHRGAPTQSQRPPPPTPLRVEPGEKVATFIGAVPTPREIVFHRNASEAINLVARQLGR